MVNFSAAWCTTCRSLKHDVLADLVVRARLAASVTLIRADVTASDAGAQALMRNMAEAKTLGLEGTPVFLVGLYTIAQALDYDGFKEAVVEARARAKESKGWWAPAFHSAHDVDSARGLPRSWAPSMAYDKKTFAGGKSPAYLNALRAFEASARHGSFSGAAGELNVTAAAVGQLVRGLEDWLGAPLFHRTASGRSRLTPTDGARQALPDIRAGLDRLSLGLDRLREGVRGGVLTVAVSPAFAAKWMLPRLDRFQVRSPDTDVRLDTGLGLADYATRGIDIGVRYGAGQWPGMSAEKLMDEDVFPVCSPALRDELDLRQPADVTRHTLIHDLSVDPGVGFATWSAWLRSAGIDAQLMQRGLQINNSAAVLQAAVDGQGIALARSILAREDLAAGRLVRLFPNVASPSALAYYVVYRSDRALRPKAESFRQWLLDEASSA